MSTDPMSGGPAYASGQPEQGGGEGGACSSCGRPLPPPDLEAVAASIDQMLSMESGRIVQRTAWAGRPPDGVMDALLFWMPSVKASRQLWERGQTLWTEQMTAALSGPCGDCQGAMATAPSGGPGPTYVQSPEPGPAPVAPTAYMPYEPSAPAGSPPGTMAPTGYLPAAEPEGEAMTSAIPAYSEQPGAPQSPPAAPPPVEDAPTYAIPAYPGGFGGTPSPASPAGPEAADVRPSPDASPPPESDEHESHTVMLSALPSLRVTTRLVVIEGPVRGRQFSLGRDRTTIGRSIGCHVTVEADTVQYDHASVVRGGEGWQIQPAGTSADVFVNGEPVRGARLLQPGDVIRIGPAQLRFESAS